MIGDPFRFYEVPPPPPPYFGGTLPEVMVSSDEVPYPYYNQLTPEEKRFFNQDNPIGRSVRSIANTGKRGQTYDDLSRVAKDVESFAAEMTGIPGAIRFSQSPLEKLAGAGRTIEATILGSSPFITSPYNQEDVADTFDALDAFGVATAAFAPFKTPLQQGIKSSGRYLSQGLKDFARRNFRNPFSRFESPVWFEDFEYLEPGVARSQYVAPPVLNRNVMTYEEANNLLRIYNNRRYGSLGDVKNQSAMTKAEAARIDPASKADIDAMPEEEFKKTVISVNRNTPRIASAPDQNEVAQYLLDSRVRPIPTDNWINEFNSQLDVLNNQIVPGRNKSGRKYEFLPMERVQGLKDFANVKIKSLNSRGDEAINEWTVKVNPGKFKGKIKDIAGEAYMDAIPGINMVNTADGVFTPMSYAPGSNAYSALNDYLKMLDLGRVKSGKNSLSDKAKKAWESHLANDRAIGHLYDNQIYAMMRSMNPYLMPMGAGYGIGSYYMDKGR